MTDSLKTSGSNAGVKDHFAPDGPEQNGFHSGGSGVDL